MKKILFTILVLSFVGISGWANNLTDKEKRCRAILQPFTADQSLSDRVDNDLVMGVWKVTSNVQTQFIQFYTSGWVDIIVEDGIEPKYTNYQWSTMQIGDVVYLRMDSGNKEDDHLYKVKQNCEGLLLTDSESKVILSLEFLSGKEGESDPLMNEKLKGDWFDMDDPNNFQLRLSSNGQYDFIHDQQIESGRWIAFKEGPYLLLFKEGDCNPKVIPIKHIDFMNLDIKTVQSKIKSLEKKDVF